MSIVSIVRWLVAIAAVVAAVAYDGSDALSAIDSLKPSAVHAGRIGSAPAAPDQQLSARFISGQDVLLASTLRDPGLGVIPGPLAALFLTGDTTGGTMKLSTVGQSVIRKPLTSGFFTGTAVRQSAPLLVVTSGASTPLTHAFVRGASFTRSEVLVGVGDTNACDRYPIVLNATEEFDSIEVGLYAPSGFNSYSIRNAHGAAWELAQLGGPERLHRITLPGPGLLRITGDLPYGIATRVTGKTDTHQARAILLSDCDTSITDDYPAVALWEGGHGKQSFYFIVEDVGPTTLYVSVDLPSCPEFTSCTDTGRYALTTSFLPMSDSHDQGVLVLLPGISFGGILGADPSELFNACARSAESFGPLIAGSPELQRLAPLCFSYSAHDSSVYSTQDTQTPLAEAADILKALLRDQDGRTVVLAHSLGGAVAATWAGSGVPTRQPGDGSWIVTLDSPIGGISSLQALVTSATNILFGGQATKDLRDPRSLAKRVLGTASIDFLTVGNEQDSVVLHEHSFTPFARWAVSIDRGGCGPFIEQNHACVLADGEGVAPREVVDAIEGVLGGSFAPPLLNVGNDLNGSDSTDYLASAPPLGLGVSFVSTAGGANSWGNHSARNYGVLLTLNQPHYVLLNGSAHSNPGPERVYRLPAVAGTVRVEPVLNGGAAVDLYVVTRQEGRTLAEPGILAWRPDPVVVNTREDILTVHSVLRSKRREGAAQQPDDPFVSAIEYTSADLNQRHYLIIDSQADGGSQVALRVTVSGIDPTVSMGVNATIGAGARVAQSVFIGDDVSLGTQARIEKQTTVGHRTIIGPSAVIKKESSIGSDVTIGAQVQVDKSVRIGDRSSVGDATMISKDVTVGSDVSIGVRVHIDNAVEIEDGVRIGDGTHISKDATVGAGAKVGTGVRINKGVQVPAGAVIPDGTEL